MLDDHVEDATDPVRSKPYVGRLLACSVRNVDRLIAEGALPVIEISPRRVGIRQSDLDKFIASRRRVRGVPITTTEGAQAA